MYAILGTNILPDLRGRFLEGDDKAGTIVEAGLPNIYGEFTGMHDYGGPGGLIKGAFYRKYAAYNLVQDSGRTSGNTIWVFSASQCSKIYGGSSTVQPPAVTVRYYIKAK